MRQGFRHRHVTLRRNQTQFLQRIHQRRRAGEVMDREARRPCAGDVLFRIVDEEHLPGALAPPGQAALENRPRRLAPAEA